MASLCPKCLGDIDRIDFVFVPPFGFVSAPVQGAMMKPAERDRELVADAAAKGGRLREPDVMGVRRASLTDEAGLRSNKFKVRAVAVAARLIERENAFVDSGVAGGRAIR